MISINFFLLLVLNGLVFSSYNEPGTNGEVYRPVNILLITADDLNYNSGIDFMPTILHALHLPEVPDMDGSSFLHVLQRKTQKNRTTVFTEFHRIFAGIDYSMRCVQAENFGYIVNFWSDGVHEIRGDAATGRTFQVMREGALVDETVEERPNMCLYRVPEELYDFKNDPNGLVNMIDDPAYQEDIGRLRELVRKENETNGRSPLG